MDTGSDERDEDEVPYLEDHERPTVASDLEGITGGKNEPALDRWERAHRVSGSILTGIGRTALVVFLAIWPRSK